jgi:hypothetical protein
MAYRIAGQYVAHCSCSLVCPCPVDGTPTGPGDKCYGASVWHVAEGELDGTDLSGVNYALYFDVPSNLSSGNITLRLVVDEASSDEQLEALRKIISGEAGGPFADFAALISELKGPDRASVTFSNGDSPSGSIGDEAEIRMELLRGPDGSPTTVSGAMFGFAPQYKIGKGSGRSTASGFSYEPVYAEAADFEYSTEMSGEQIRPRA